MEGAIKLGDDDVFAGIERAIENTGDGDASEVVAVIKVGDEDLERTVRLALGWRGGVDDGFEEGRQVFSGDFGVGGSCANLSVRIKDGKVELIFLGVEVDKEIVDLVQDFLRAGVRTVDLINNDDLGEAGLESLAENVAGLGQGAFTGINE